MTEGALLPKIISFAIPLMASSLLQLLFNAADVVVVGRFAGNSRRGNRGRGGDGGTKERDAAQHARRPAGEATTNCQDAIPRRKGNRGDWE